MTETFTCPTCKEEVFSTLKVGDVCHDCHAALPTRTSRRAAMNAATDDAADREEFAKLARETGNKVVTPQNAAIEELARRELARRRLLPFITRFLPSYEAGWVHQDICARLEKFSEDVAQKKSPRLMLFMPPRHGKSEIASRNFPAWHLGRNPQHEVIAVSYSSSLALKFSRKVRSMLREPGFAELFPDCNLDPDTQSLENWMTTKGGSYMAAGVSGPLTGNGMHVGIIDDPVKNREEAESQTVRDSQKDWYTSTFYTRLAPGAGILVILTRWHHDDLAGWLLREAEEGGDEWEVVMYPAVAIQDEKYRKQGEALHPARYNEEALKRIRRAVGPRDWQALYQQQPTGDEGDYFRREFIKYYCAEDLPPLNELTRYTAWDLAIGEKESNDWTVGITVGVDRTERVWVLDLRRGRWDSLQIVDQILDSFALWEDSYVGIERGQLSMAIGPLLERRIAERKLWHFPYDKEGLKPGKRDKQLRARPIQGRMRQNMVMFPRPEDKPWVDGLIQELLAFPSGVHDDQVDALAWIGQMMQQFTIVPEDVEKKPSWRDKLSQLTRTSGPNGSHMGA